MGFRLTGERDIMYLSTNNKTKSDEHWKDFVSFASKIKDLHLDTCNVHVPLWVFNDILKKTSIRRWKFIDEHGLLNKEDVGYCYPQTTTRPSEPYKLPFGKLLEWMSRDARRKLVLQSMKLKNHPTWIAWTLIVF